jgi:hypothetical protein
MRHLQRVHSEEIGVPTTTKPVAARKSAKPATSRMSLAETMAALEKAGSAQSLG